MGLVDVEMLYLIDPSRDLQRRPDVAFVSFQRWPLRTPIPETNAWEVVPDLAIEVVSPTDRAEDLLDKVRDYLQCGVRAVWLAFPKARVVSIYEGSDDLRVVTGAGELDDGAVVPGFRLSLKMLFEDAEGGQTG